MAACARLQSASVMALASPLWPNTGAYYPGLQSRESGLHQTGAAAEGHCVPQKVKVRKNPPPQSLEHGWTLTNKAEPGYYELISITVVFPSTDSATMFGFGPLQSVANLITVKWPNGQDVASYVTL